MVLKFNEYIKEGFLSKTINRSKSGDIRREEGVTVKTPFTTIHLKDNENGHPYKLTKDDYYAIVDLDGDKEYVFGYVNDKEDSFTYYIYDKFEEELKVISTSNYDLTEDDFIILRALYANVREDRPIDIYRNTNNPCVKYSCDNTISDFMVLDGYEDACTYAKYTYQDDVSNKINEDDIYEFIDSYGDDFIDMDELETKVDDPSNCVQSFIEDNGFETFLEYVDFEKLAEHVIENDGLCTCMIANDEYIFKDGDKEIYIYELN